MTNCHQSSVQAGKEDTFLRGIVSVCRKSKTVESAKMGRLQLISFLVCFATGAFGPGLPVSPIEDERNSRPIPN